ncbi:hypothetical protein [Bacillus sp. 1P06AnD]|uniref:hypothetical protein n=1 Tax=Bacillus sp. 1P06AnD TaxID=3132208 RepID=UPI0039A11499
MNYPSKTFKIQAKYKKLFQVCLDVVSRDKSELTSALLKEKIGLVNFNLLPTYDFNELISTMIYNLKILVDKSSYNEVKSFIQHHEKVSEILPYLSSISNHLTGLHVRVSNDISKIVYQLKKETLGEVIELAILWFVIQSSKETYNLIKFTVQSI